MKNTVRSFIAVETSTAVRQRAAELVELLSVTGAKVSWVKPHNMHLTIKFLNEVRWNTIADVTAAVQRAAQTVEPFELEIGGAGAFPSAGRPRTLWLGTTVGSEPLAVLAAAHGDGLEAAGFPQGASPLRRSPHARPRSRRGAERTRAGEAIRQHAAFSAGRFTVRELVVFSSELLAARPEL